jgi:hypothetical protein
VEFTGRLAVFPMSALLQWAKQERATGSLVVLRREREKRILFRRGEILGCYANDSREYFGNYLLSHGLVEPSVLGPVLAASRKNGKRIGETLVAAGGISTEELRRALRRAIEESTCDLFLWRRGLFYFEDGAPPEESLLPEPIDTFELVLEGTRWMDEHARLRKVFVDDLVELGHGPKWPAERLDPYSTHVLKGLTGTATLADVHRRAGGVIYPILEVLAKMTRAGVVEIVSAGQGSVTESSEIDIRHLLMQQAKKEEVVISRERALLPLEFLEVLCPVWIRPRTEEELAVYGADQQRFLRGFDGRTPIQKLLAADEETRADQIEALLVEIRKRDLALLPARLEEVERRLDEASPLKRLWKKLSG